MQSIKYQTLSEFIRSPFNKRDAMAKNTKYETMYQKFMSENKIRIAGYMEVEDSYYIHVKIPSESNKGENYEYDVVIRFFTDRIETQAQPSLTSYYIQFFSNSPGFIYQYATLYKREGYLIESLYNKLDPEFMDKMPEKTNNGMELSYDKSIYFACRHLSEMKFRVLNKKGIILQKKKTPDRFMADISDFKSVKFDQDMMNADKQLKRQLEAKRQSEKMIQKRVSDSHRSPSSKSTTKGSPSSITYAVKKTGAGNIKKKKTASKTTKR